MAMREVFLSASIPVKGRGNFDDTADPFLIQFAVRELVNVCLGRVRIVWGGHPSITPMVHAVCVDRGVQDFNQVVGLYQSEFFAKQFPESNRFFRTTIIPEVYGDKDKSLSVMREAMIARPEIYAAVFIGGMDGIFEEAKLFQKYHGDGGLLIPITAPGGAARELAERYSYQSWDRLDFARMFYKALDIDPNSRPEFGF